MKKIACFIFHLLTTSIVFAGEAINVSAPMIHITGGCFQMGSPESEDGHDLDEMQNRTCVKDFEIGRYEVTQRQWQAVMGNNPSQFQGCANCPVETVSWNDVQDYLRKLNQQTGKTYRLPTEAEWEYACRGGAAGERYCGGDDIDRLAWHDGNSGEKTHPVGQKAPNQFGLYDMTGNVMEWMCSPNDWGDYSMVQKCIDTPYIPVAVKGGSWYNTRDRLRSAYRGGDVAGARNFTMGFRLASSL